MHPIEWSKITMFFRFLYRYRILLTLIPVLVILFLIFSFSAQTADQSNATSHSILDWILQILEPDYSSLSALQKAALYHQYNHSIRKAAHFIEFAALGFFLSLFITVIPPNNGRAFSLSEKFGSYLISLLLCVFFAMFDEFHQRFVAGRAPGVSDVLIDSSGALAGILLLFLVRQIVIHQIAKKRN